MRLGALIMISLLIRAAPLNLLRRASVSRFSTMQLGKVVCKPKVIFVLGGPGSGKGTHCVRLSQDFGIQHLSAGELLRQEIGTGTDNGKLIEEYLKLGKIVPVEISLNLLRGAIQTSPCHRFLIDGFPRNWDNLSGWNAAMKDVCDLEMVLFFECNQEELERRVVERGATSGRSDDNLETFRRRFRSFQTETMPVVNYFANLKDCPLVRIDGIGSIEDIYGRVKDAVIPLVAKDAVDVMFHIKDESG